VYDAHALRYILRVNTIHTLLVFFLGTVFLLTSSLSAQESDGSRVPPPDEVCASTDSEPPKITEIRFQGLKRTKPTVLRRAVDAGPGVPYTEEVRQEIRRDLRSLGLFDRVEVEPEPSAVTGDRVVVQVVVRERWTLVPIPFFTTTSGGTSGGLFVIENNLLGYNKQLITGGAYGSAGFNGLLVYSDPAILGSSYLGAVSLSVGRSEEEAVSLKEETLADWEADYSRGRLRLGYRFGDSLTTTTFLAARQERFKSGRLAPGANETEAAVYHGASVRYSDQNPLRYFNAGYALEIEGEYELGGGSEREWNVAAQFSQDFLLFQDHRLRYALRAEESDRAYWRVTRLGGTETQRTIDRGSVPAERYVSGGLTYEFPVFRPDWGTFTLLGFYEGGALLEADEQYHGPGAGFRLYVSRVTLPALGFDLAYRGTEDIWLFSFSIGMSM
jgi:outer membrane protein assembly factor BamA